MMFDEPRQHGDAVEEGGHIPHDDPRLLTVGGDDHNDPPFTGSEVVTIVTEAR